MTIIEGNKKQFNVLFLPSYYPTKEDLVQGIFIREHAQAVALFDNVVVLYPQESNRTNLRLSKFSDSIEDGIRTIRIPYPSSRFTRLTGIRHYWYWSFLKGFIYLLRCGFMPDMIHAHVFNAGIPAIILGWRYKIPVVITEHYTNFATHSATFLDQLKAKFTLGKANVILPVSNDLKKALHDHYHINNNFHVVPNVVNTSVYYPSICQTREKDGKKRMLLVAVLTPRKGIKYLLEALNRIKLKRQDYFLDIVGTGPNRTDYEEEVKKLGLSDFVKFHGRQPEVASFMRNCDFFILPSLYENFGVVYIEAMACGKPVIATNAGGPNEVVNEEVGLLVPPKDVDALVEVIIYMLDHFHNYNPEKLVEYARTKYSYEVVGQEIHQTYLQVITDTS